MFNIFICEDDHTQRLRIEMIINKYFMLNDFDMSLAFSTDDPIKLLNHLKSQDDGYTGLYFLDVELQSDINGIELAAEIRKLDVSATIVFVTSHSELVPLVFKHKVEAMEYIVKDNSPEEIEKSILTCIDLAFKRFLDGKRSATKYFTIKIGEQVLNIPYDNILYFESSVDMRNKVLLHTLDSMLEFRGFIKDVSSLGSPFYEVHQSFVLNINKIEHVDKVTREAKMINGEFIPIAVRKMTTLLNHMAAE